METAKSVNIEKPSDDRNAKHGGIYVVRTFGKSDLLDLFADYVVLKIGTSNTDD